VNADGEVEGMDTAASEGFNFQTQGNQGFAIPISFAMSIARDIESGKDTSTVHVGQTAFLGLLLSPPGQAATSGAAPSGSPFGGTGGTAVTCPANPAGLEVSGVVAGTPAQKAGITGCDTITTFNGSKLSSAEDLTKLLVDYHPGQKVTIGWVTSTGQARSAPIVLASGPPS
jgi:S1-C subfamily serine protease